MLTKETRIAVIGAGAIGGITAAFIKQAGWNIEVVCKHRELAVNGNKKCTKNGKMKMYHLGIHNPSVFPLSATASEVPAMATSLFENVWPRRR